MAGLEAVVDEVIAAFRARRRTGWSPTGPSLTGAGGELGRWKARIDARLKTFRRSVVDRELLLERTRRRFERAEWSVDFAAVADERVVLGELERDRCWWPWLGSHWLGGRVPFGVGRCQGHRGPHLLFRALLLPCTSSLRTVPIPWPSVMTALLAPLRLRKNVSLDSFFLSPMTITVTVWLV